MFCISDKHFSMLCLVYRDYSSFLFSVAALMAASVAASLAVDNKTYCQHYNQ